MTKPSVRYPKSINVRVTEDAASLVERVAKRRKVDEATVVRWWLDELPEDYVPGEGRWARKSKSIQIVPESSVYIPTGIAELDSVLNGGVVLGKTLLLDGVRGVGKTTLLLKVCDGFAQDGRKAYFVTGEMTQDAVTEYAKRLGIVNENVTLLADPSGIDVEQLTDNVLATKSQLVIVDSMQVSVSSGVKSDLGTPPMLDAVTNWMTSFATAKKRAVILIGHRVDGYAGTERMLHLVDGVVKLDPVCVSDDQCNIRDSKIRKIWIDGKFRQGRADRTAYVEMVETGFQTPSADVLRRAGVIPEATPTAARIRISTGTEIDAVLGDGLVLGNTVLLGGPPGVGRTTVALQMAAGFTKSGRKALFASGEMTERAVREYMERLGVPDDVRVHCDASGIDITDVFDKALAAKAKLIVIDTAQTTLVSDVRGDIGKPTMLDAVANMATSFAQEKDVAVILICHDNRDGDFAGTEMMQHLVDVLVRIAPLYVHDDRTGDADSMVRKIYVDGKSRQGPANVVKYMEMTESGFKTPSHRALRNAGLL